MYVGGGESEAPIHDIELMPDHYAKDLAFEFLEKFARFECGMKEARFCKRDGKEGRAGLNWEKFKVKLGPRPTEQPRLKLLFSPAVPKPRCVSFPPRLFSYAGAASHKPKVGIEHLAMKVFSARRLFVRDRHQAECVGTVARPVVHGAYLALRLDF